MDVRLERFGFWLWAAVVVMVGAAVRFEQLPERVLHLDEGVQAFQTWRLMETGQYDYAPEDRHGPVLYFLSAGLMSLAGVSAGELSANELRLVSTLAGLGLLAGVAGWGASRGDLAWLFGATVLAVSPFVVCYQNYYIQESWLAALSLVLVWWLAATGKRVSAADPWCLGALVGLLFALKETTLVHVGALLIAWVCVRCRAGWEGDWSGKALLRVGIAAMVVWALAMTQGFRRWDALADGVAALAHYSARAGGSGHEKPMLYYFSLFVPQFQAGVWWSQLGVFLGGILGTVLAWRKRHGEAGTWALLGAFSWGLFFLYSFIPYKTPWLMLTPTMGFCLLTGYGAAEVFRARPRWFGRGLSLGAMALVTTEAVGQWRPALFRYADDSRNPYLYTHTSPGFGRLVQRLEELRAVAPDASIAVVEPKHAWPLPWYLRNDPRVGYFSEPPVNLARYDLVVLDARLAETLPASELDGYVSEVHGLRTNVLLFLFVREPIWEEFMETPATPSR